VPSRTVTSSAGAILFEAAGVVLAGAALAFAANAISPRGLDVTRNYFPGGARQVVSPPKFSQPAVTGATTNDPVAEVDQRIRDKGLNPIDRVKTEQFFRDPRYEEGLIIFVDARDEDHYRDGHIPGAYKLDPFHPDKELGDVLNRCELAAQVIVYCAGGDCEDADSTAIMLRDAGIPNDKLFVYGGGITEWSERHLPLEEGARKGGAAPGPGK
jgi:rhodanese-related sulfurtransferase